MLKAVEAWLFGRCGLLVSLILFVGASYFVFAALNGPALVWPRLQTNSEVQSEQVIIDVFWGLQAFALAHFWFAGAVLACLRNTTLLRSPRVLVQVIAFPVILGAGHWVAWRASQRGISFGVIPW